MTKQACQVLIIDDCPEDRATFRRFLSEKCRGKYVVADAEHWQEGLALAGGADCVLLDYRFPDRDALGLIKELAPDDRGVPARPVIMVTGQGDEGVAVQAMKEGAQDYLIKNRLTPEDLERAIAHAIEKVSLLRQVEEHRRELEQLATLDSLTGLYNRRSFLQRLDQEIARVRRFGAPLSFLLIDLDHFKTVNDSHGHLVGDRVLAQVGQVLKSSLRETDLAGRYGGEEFGVLAIGAHVHGAEALARRLRERVAAETYLDQTPFSLTCSIGAAELAPEMQTGLDLVAAADRGLYQAKQAGRNCVQVATRAAAQHSWIPKSQVPPGRN